MIKAGDIVKVKDWGERYPSAVSWFMLHQGDIKLEWIIRYSYEAVSKSVPSDLNCEKYKVLYIKDGKVLITGEDDNHGDVNNTYLINISALEPVDDVKVVTMEELEKLLGYKVKIVSSKE